MSKEGPCEDGHALFEAFNNVCDGYTLSTVQEASMNLAIASLVYGAIREGLNDTEFTRFVDDALAGIRHHCLVNYSIKTKPAKPTDMN